MDIHNEIILFSRDVSGMDEDEFCQWTDFINLLPSIEDEDYRPNLMTDVDWIGVMRGVITNACTQRELDLYFQNLVKLYPNDQVMSLYSEITSRRIEGNIFCYYLCRVAIAIRRALDGVH